YEQWRSANKDASYRDFQFKSSNMGNSGAMFDLAKFNDVSKNIIASMTADEVYENVKSWADENDADFYKLLVSDENYAKSFFAIGRGGKKPRKDFACWSEVKDFVSYYYDELFKVEEPFPGNVPESDRKAILKDYAEVYSPEDDNSAWFEKVKAISEKYGYTSDMKAFKENPEAFKGSVTDVSNIIRVAVTGRNNSPDLCAVMQVLGKDRVLKRISAFA
ncbi:MAG: glutamate--tRNA ligase, partial [Clostridia bacterium]|nr:glutamate--tRNA ligase [Clostridia bacterium]